MKCKKQNGKRLKSDIGIAEANLGCSASVAKMYRVSKGGYGSKRLFG